MKVRSHWGIDRAAFLELAVTVDFSAWPDVCGLSDMETEGAGASERKILEAMEAAEPTQATEVLSNLTGELHARGVNGVNLTGMWNSFKRLLHRRGYYVGTPAQVEKTLEEIATIGEGFDLFDLAKNLAHYDAVRMECRGLTSHRALPELQRFASPCTCKPTLKERKHA